MNTTPPAPKLRPPSDPIKIETSTVELDALEHAHHALDRARLMLTYAIECDGSGEAEHRAMLLDAALSALAPAIVEIGRTLRLLNFRRRVAKENRARTLARRSSVMPYHPIENIPTFRSKNRRK